MPKSSKPRKAHNRLKTDVSRRRTDRRTHPFHALRTFAPIYAMFDQLRTGFVETNDGSPIMRAWNDTEAYLITPAMDGWIACWQRIVDAEKLPIDLAPLKQMHRYMENGVMLTKDLIDKCEAVTDLCQRAFLSMPREIFIRHSTTEMIAEQMAKITPPAP